MDDTCREEGRKNKELVLFVQGDEGRDVIVSSVGVLTLFIVREQSRLIHDDVLLKAQRGDRTLPRESISFQPLPKDKDAVRGNLPSSPLYIK